MAGKKLASVVHVYTDEGVKVYGPGTELGDEVPAADQKQISNPKAWGEDPKSADKK